MTVEWFDRDLLDETIPTRVRRTSVVLDIGCGIRPQSYFYPHLHICCEPHWEYVSILRNGRAADPGFMILQGTALQVLPLLPDRTVDSVFLVDVLEHLEKEDGRRLLQEMQRVAREQIVVFTPLGFLKQHADDDGIDGWSLHGGQWQEHLSGWMPEEFDDTWSILACTEYHATDASGAPLTPPHGAFWAIKNVHIPPTGIPLPVKLALVSDILPNDSSPTGRRLSRILRGVSPEDYCVLSSREAAVVHLDSPTQASRLPFGSVMTRQVSISSEARPVRLWSHDRAVRKDAEVIKFALQQERAGALLACSGIPNQLAASLVACRDLEMPFFVYLPEEHLSMALGRRSLWTRTKLLRHAAGVVVTSPNVHRRCRHWGIKAILLPSQSEPGPTSGAGILQTLFRFQRQSANPAHSARANADG